MDKEYAHRTAMKLSQKLWVILFPDSNIHSRSHLTTRRVQQMPRIQHIPNSINSVGAIRHMCQLRNEAMDGKSALTNPESTYPLFAFWFHLVEPLCIALSLMPSCLSDKRKHDERLQPTSLQPNNQGYAWMIDTGRVSRVVHERMMNDKQWWC